VKYDAKHKVPPLPQPISIVIAVALSFSSAAKASTMIKQPTRRQKRPRSRRPQEGGKEHLPALQVVRPPPSPFKCFQVQMQLEQEEQVLETRMGGQEDGATL